MAVKKEQLIQVLQEIEIAHGVVTPEALLKASESPSSPTHDLFEWDDKVSAHQYRLWQARQAIRSVEVEVVGIGKTRKYWNATVEIEDTATQGYFSLEKVQNSEVLYKSILSDALQELEHWEEKYKQVESLRGLVNQSKKQELKAQA